MSQLTTKGRSSAWARKKGWLVADVEQKSYGGGRTLYHDLWGLFDLLVMDTDSGDSIFVQATGSGDVAAHVRKAEEKIRSFRPPKTFSKSPEPFAAVVSLGFKAEIWSWGRWGPKNRENPWQLRRKAMILDSEGKITLENLAPV